jgi:hypothetical protein
MEQITSWKHNIGSSGQETAHCYYFKIIFNIIYLPMPKSMQLPVEQPPWLYTRIILY